MCDFKLFVEKWQICVCRFCVVSASYDLRSQRGCDILKGKWGGVTVDIQVNDILVMKKPHPCGGARFRVLRIGMDFRLRCEACGHELMIPRVKAEKNVRSLERSSEE